jgi:thiol-disulfide isomerase/thioredoxin
MFFIFLASSAYGDCPLQSNAITTERHDISVQDMSQLFEQSKGCTTVIELWASWCGPCVRLAPEVQQFHDAHPDVLFLSISADATGGAAEKFWKQHPPIGQKRRLSSWSMASLQQTYSQIGGTFPEAIPYFVVLDESGQIQFETHEPNSLRSLTKAVEALAPQVSKEDTP